MEENKKIKQKFFDWRLTGEEACLLEKLYTIHSPSGEEDAMADFVTNRLKSYGCEVWRDDIGNVYAQKGDGDTYPCVVAHLDQVQSERPSDFMVCTIKGQMFGWSPYEKRQCGLGADDKNGIFIALMSAWKFDNIKVAFFVGEEVGCVGSSQCDLNFFKDCRFIIEPDRKGAYDLITTMGGVSVCSDDFIDAIPYKYFNYNKVDGIYTDVLTLVERGVGISCINVSCGYYFPHTEQEVTNLYNLGKCRAFVFKIIQTCRDVYPFEYRGRDTMPLCDYEYWNSLYDAVQEDDIDEIDNYKQ